MHLSKHDLLEFAHRHDCVLFGALKFEHASALLHSHSWTIPGVAKLSLLQNYVTFMVTFALKFEDSLPMSIATIPSNSSRILPAEIRLQYTEDYWFPIHFVANS